jgi:hypothetical protein
MHVRRALALTAVVPLLLAGCSDDPEPQPKMPDPPASSSSSPSPTASETVEAESAKEFIRRWQAAADEMVVTGETNPFLELSRGCGPCSAYAGQVADVYERGGRVEFGQSKVVDIDEERGRPPTFEVEVEAPRLRILVPNEDPQIFSAATQRYRMTLKETADGFQMRHYAVM